MAFSFLNKIKKAVSDAADFVGTTAKSTINAVGQIFTDTSHMSWQERLNYYQSLESIDGYVKALRLTDFCAPGDFKLVDVWDDALEKHPELTLDIYTQTEYLVTTSEEMWRRILKIHIDNLKLSAPEYRKSIGVVVGLIQCNKLRELESGIEQLKQCGYDVDGYAIASSGDWAFLEKYIKSRLRNRINDAQDILLNTAHSMANYAFSCGNVAQTAEIIENAIEQFGGSPDLSLEWRLAILNRDLEHWKEYTDLLRTTIVSNTKPVEEKVDVYYELIRVYNEILGQENNATDCYESIFALAHDNIDAVDYLSDQYERHNRWSDYINILKTHADSLPFEQRARIADLYLRIAKGFLHRSSECKTKTAEYEEFCSSAITYFEKSLRQIYLDDKPMENPLYNEAYECLKTTYTEANAWKQLIDLLKKRIVYSDDSSEQVSILKQIADIAENKLNDKALTIDSWKQIIDRDAKNIEAFEALSELYKDDWGNYASLLAARADVSDDKTKIDLYLKVANVYRDKPFFKGDAIKYYEKVLEIEPTNSEGIEQLMLIYTEDEDWNKLIEVQLKELNLHEDPKEQIILIKMMIDTAKYKAHNNGLVIRLWNMILELDPSNTEATQAIDGFLKPNDSKDKSNIDESVNSGESKFVKGLKYVTAVHAYQERQMSVNNKEEADRLKSEVEEETKNRRDQLNSALDEFGKYRLEAMHNTIGRFLKCMERLNQRSKMKEYELLKAIDLQERELAEMKQIDMQASEAMKTLAVGGGFAAVGLVGTPVLVTATVTAIGAASTGTAISALSGAAAHSAVLAWLGGGSLAAGGGGMAAGAAVLTTITAAATVLPATIAMGALASAYYSKKNTESEQYLAEVSKWAAEIKQSWVMLDGINKRIIEMQDLTHKLEERAITMLDKLESIIEIFDKTNHDHVQLFQQNALIAKSMSELAQTPVLDTDGKINESANIIIDKTEKVLNTQL